jgi:biotin carboxyl carrier protein
MIVNITDKTFDVLIKEEHGHFAALIDNELVEIEPEFDKNGQIASISLNGKKYTVRLHKTKDNYEVSIFIQPLTAVIEQIVTDAESKPIDQNSVVINSPMSGLVINLPIKIGQEVPKDSQLLILEAMKMQNEIKSPIHAKVTDIFVKVGQTVEKDSKLLVLQPL